MEITANDDADVARVVVGNGAAASSCSMSSAGTDGSQGNGEFYWHQFEVPAEASKLRKAVRRWRKRGWTIEGEQATEPVPTFLPTYPWEIDPASAR
jgi:hypothetical protein